MAIPLLEEIAFVQICKECGFKQYRLNYSLKAFIALQHNVGLIWCDRCKKKSVELKQLKLKDWSALRQKFPNKKAIYTEKTVEELLKLPDDVGVNPDIDGVLCGG